MLRSGHAYHLKIRVKDLNFFGFIRAWAPREKARKTLGKGPQDFGKGRGTTDPVKGDPGKGKTTAGKGIGQGQRNQHDDTTPGR